MRRQILVLCSGLLITTVVAPLAHAAETRPRQPALFTQTLQGVSADSRTDAWAVGWSNHHNVRTTLVEHWDGTRWQVVKSPNRSPSKDDVLSGVEALSPTDVWAVGFYQTRKQGIYRGEILHYDGRRWAHVPSPSGHHYTVLRDISAVSPDDIWAVGENTKQLGQYRPYFEHWDGTSWSMVEDTLPRKRNGPVEAVSVVTRDDVWAGGAHALFHKDSSWSPVEDVVNVQDLTMLWATDGWAVGGDLTLHWNGTDWVDTPDAGVYKYAVTGTSPTDVWAGGDGFEHWDGAHWTAVDGSTGEIFAMDARAPHDVWAVGDHFGGGMVIEHWDGKTWTVVQG